jgi:hypothetical protein
MAVWRLRGVRARCRGLSPRCQRARHWEKGPESPGDQEDHPHLRDSFLLSQRPQPKLAHTAWSVRRKASPGLAQD